MHCTGILWEVQEQRSCHGAEKWLPVGSLRMLHIAPSAEPSNLQVQPRCSRWGANLIVKACKGAQSDPRPGVEWAGYALKGLHKIYALQILGATRFSPPKFPSFAHNALQNSPIYGQDTGQLHIFYTYKMSWLLSPVCHEHPPWNTRRIDPES